MDGPDPPVARSRRRTDHPRLSHVAGREAPELRRRHHLRHEQRDGFRLPARQHGAEEGRQGPTTRPQLLHRRRGRLDPHRRGPHAADHLRSRRRRRQAVLPVRVDRARPEARRRLRGGRGQACRRAARGGHREGRGGARRREPVRQRPVQLRPPVHRGAEGQGAVQARQGLHRAGRRGEDRRRVHRPHPRRSPLVGRHPPGGRGEGGREDQGGEPDPRHDHAPELLPHVRKARRHDRHGPDRGRRADEHLRARGRADPDQPCGAAHRPGRPHLQERRGEVQRDHRRHRAPPREGPADPRRHRQRQPERASRSPARPAWDRPRGVEREAAHP